MQYMITLTIGAGEVGKSLHSVLSKKYTAYIQDVETKYEGDVDVLNICFPYSKNFVKTVMAYQKQYAPTLTIIHSTVPVGTSRMLNAVHSPIHGKHPNLQKGIKTFVKYVGAPTKKQAQLANNFLKCAGILTKIVSSPEASEASKIWCTTQYGWNIVLMKEIKRYCDENKLKFDEVYGWNKHYNTGYEILNMEYFRRPVLTYSKGKIGGHCVVPNCRLLKSDIAKFILKKNETYH